MLLIVFASILAVLFVAYLYIRIPITKGLGHDYYTNYIFVFVRRSPGGSFISIDLPDLVPFIRDSIVWGAQPFSFRFVGDFSRDRHSSGTFNHIYRDNSHVIYLGRVVWDSDPESLRLFKGYATDKKHVYMRGYVSQKLDPETFELLGCGFWKDKNSVYCDHTGFENPIPETDLETFEVIDSAGCNCQELYTAKDKNRFYKNDASGFRVIEHL